MHTISVKSTTLTEVCQRLFATKVKDKFTMIGYTIENLQLCLLEIALLFDHPIVYTLAD